MTEPLLEPHQQRRLQQQSLHESSFSSNLEAATATVRVRAGAQGGELRYLIRVGRIVARRTETHAARREHDPG